MAVSFPRRRKLTSSRQARCSLLWTHKKIISGTCLPSKDGLTLFGLHYVGTGLSGWDFVCGAMNGIVYDTQAGHQIVYGPIQHGKDFNVVFCDGHVEAAPRTNLFNMFLSARNWNVDNQPHEGLWTGNWFLMAFTTGFIRIVVLLIAKKYDRQANMQVSVGKFPRATRGYGRLHVDRTSGRHRDHRHPCSDAAARLGTVEGGGPIDRLQKPPSPNGTCNGNVRG